MDKNAEDKITKILLRAMQAETDGYLFYTSASKNIEDVHGREVFESLARDELNHLHFLKAQYKSITENGEPDSKLKIGKPSVETEATSIFSEAFKAKLSQSHYEMSALSIGIHLESAQIDFYKTQAENVDEPTVKSFLTELAGWESSHHHQLIRQQEELKEDYWFKGGFYPF